MANPDPIDVLVETSDPTARAKAHKALGARARERQEPQLAEWHLREALDLDPTDETTAEELRAMGKIAEPETERPRTSLRDFMFRVKRRVTGA